MCRSASANNLLAKLKMQLPHPRKSTLIFTLDISLQLEIYDGPVEESQQKPNEEEISLLEEKVSVARKYVWGWTSSVKVTRTRNVT